MLTKKHEWLEETVEAAAERILSLPTDIDEEDRRELIKDVIGDAIIVPINVVEQARDFWYRSYVNMQKSIEAGATSIPGSIQAFEA